MQSEHQGTISKNTAIAGFWRRLAAFLIDVLFLGILGLALGSAFFDFFAGLGSWGRFIGFFVALVYFGLADSALTKGQTLGKRLMRIRVISTRGTPLNPGHAALRYVIVGVPYFLNGLPLDWQSHGEWLFSLLSLLVVGLGLSICYMYVFNRRTRQSVHDVLTESYVIRASISEGPPSISPWKGHFVVVALVLAASALAPLLVSRLANVTPFKGLLALQQAIQADPEVRYASVIKGESHFFSVQSGSRTTRDLLSRVVLARKIQDCDGFANRVAGIILAKYPEASGMDALRITVAYGYDIGIASSWTNQLFDFSPAQWRNRLATRKKSNV